MNPMIELIENNPVIPGIKEESDIDLILQNEAKIVIVLFGDIMNITTIIDRLKEAGKTVFINIDLIAGLSNKDIVVDFIKKHTQVDGIISSKASLLRYAKDIGFFTIHRFFIVDSFSYYNIQKQLFISKADVINVLPGWPKVISWISEEIKKPVIAAGLVCDRKSVNENLSAGAIAICSTNHTVWDM